MLNFSYLEKMHKTYADYGQIISKMQKGSANFAKIQKEEIEIGLSLKKAVYKQDKLILYKYKTLVEKPFKVPILICYALVNRPYIVDFDKKVSLVRSLLSLGFEVYLIDWGYPGREDRYLTLTDYVDRYINNCVDYILDSHKLKKLNLLGVCQGGVLSLIYASICSNKIKNLITMVTPVDFHCSQSLLGLWARGKEGEGMDLDLAVEALGNVPGDLMNLGYLMLKPFELGLRKYLQLIQVMDEREKLVHFLKMEKWIFDSPDQAGTAWKEFVLYFYRQNKLVAGDLSIGEKQVSLANIRMPVLNILAEKDHLVPPESTKKKKVPTATLR